MARRAQRFERVVLMAVSGEAATDSIHSARKIKNFRLSFARPIAPFDLGGGPGQGAGDAIFTMSERLKPRILYREKAKYTEEARQNRIQGTVVLNVVFGANGRIHDIRTISSLPHGLTETAIEATQRIRFQPAVQNGRAVSVRATLEFNFALY